MPTHRAFQGFASFEDFFKAAPIQSDVRVSIFGSGGGDSPVLCGTLVLQTSGERALTLERVEGIPPSIQLDVRFPAESTILFKHFLQLGTLAALTEVVNGGYLRHSAQTQPLSIIGSNNHTGAEKLLLSSLSNWSKDIPRRLKNPAFVALPSKTTGIAFAFKIMYLSSSQQTLLRNVIPVVMYISFFLQKMREFNSLDELASHSGLEDISMEEQARMLDAWIGGGGAMRLKQPLYAALISPLLIFTTDKSWTKVNTSRACFYATLLETYSNKPQGMVEMNTVAWDFILRCARGECVDFDVELNALLEDLDGCRDKLSEGEKNWFKIVDPIVNERTPGRPSVAEESSNSNPAGPSVTEESSHSDRPKRTPKSASYDTGPLAKKPKKKAPKRKISVDEQDPRASKRNKLADIKDLDLQEALLMIHELSSVIVDNPDAPKDIRAALASLPGQSSNSVRKTKTGCSMAESGQESSDEEWEREEEGWIKKIRSLPIKESKAFWCQEPERRGELPIVKMCSRSAREIAIFNEVFESASNSVEITPQNECSPPSIPMPLRDPVTGVQNFAGLNYVQSDFFRSLSQEQKFQLLRDGPFKITNRSIGLQKMSLERLSHLEDVEKSIQVLCYDERAIQDYPSAIDLLRTSSLKRIFEEVACEERSKGGGLRLNALDIKGPVGVEPDITLASAKYSADSTNFRLPAIWLNLLRQDQTFGIASTANSFTYVHSDALGLETVLHMYCGVKAIVLYSLKEAKFPKSTRFRSFDTTKMMDKAIWNARLALMFPGEQMRIPPQYFHAVATLIPAITTGYHFYSVATLSDSVGAIFEDFIRGILISNQYDWDSAFASLSCLLLHCSDQLRFEDMYWSESIASRNHVPFLFSPPGFQGLVSLLSIFQFIELLTPDYYTATLSADLEEMFIRARSAGNALMDHLCQCNIVNSPCSTLRELVDAWVVHLLELLIDKESWRTLDDEGSNDPSAYAQVGQLQCLEACQVALDSRKGAVNSPFDCSSFYLGSRISSIYSHPYF